MRNLFVAAMVCLVLGTITSTSEAGAGGKSFKIESSAGTLAGAAFEDNLFGLKPAGILVHTPEGDFDGIYTEAAVVGGLVTTVNGFAIDNGYVGSFQALVIDIQFTTPGTSTILGFGLGSTGPYFFSGKAKN